MIELMHLAAVQTRFCRFHCMGVVHAKYAPVVFVMEREVIPNTMGPLPRWWHAPRFNLPPVTIIPVHLTAMYGQKLF
nr:hypothetical protein [Marinobacter sp. SS5-14b]